MGKWLEEHGTNIFANIDPETLGMPDELITSRLDVKEWADLKEKSLTMHRTQMNPDSPFNKMPTEILEQLRAVEYYALAAGTPLPSTETQSDLFAGLRG
jgi:mycothiol S-conjugate amidase